MIEPWHYTTLLDALDHWQTLVAGVLAVTGGVIAVGGAIWGARMQCKAVRDATAQEITAMQATTSEQITVARAAAQAQVDAATAQTSVVQQQNDELKRANRRTLARETLIAARLLDASLAMVQADIKTARERFGGPSTNSISKEGAISIRQLVGKPRFDDLWPRVALLGVGGEVAVNFQYLDSLIDRLRADTSTTTVGELTDHLTRLGAIVQRLRESAADDALRANGVLAEGQ